MAALFDDDLADAEEVSSSWQDGVGAIITQPQLWVFVSENTRRKQPFPCHCDRDV